MTISFQCSSCGRGLKVADELAGRKAKCPQCKAVLYISEGKKSAVTSAPAPPPARKKAAPAPPPEKSDETRDDEADEPRKRRGKKIKGKEAKRSLLLPLLIGGGTGGVDSANIDKMLMVSQPFTGAGAAQSNSIVIIRTKQPVKPADVEASIQKNLPGMKFNESKAGRFTLYEGQGAAAPAAFGPAPPPPAFVMPDDKRVVAGPAALLRTVLERDKKPDVPDKLQGLLKQADLNATVVFVADARNAFPKGPGLQMGAPGQPAKNPFEKVDGLIVTANVTNDVDATVTATCTDPQAADELRDTVKKSTDQLKALLNVAALMGKGPPPEVTDLLDLNPQVSEATVTLTKKNQVGPLLKYAKEQQQQQQQKQPGLFPPRK